VAPYFRLPVNREALTSVTRGLVGDTSFAVLPEITPRLTFILTILTQLVQALVPASVTHPLTTSSSPLSQNSSSDPTSTLFSPPSP